MNAQLPSRYFTPFQVAVASAFGTLFAGFVCVALNCQAAQNPRGSIVVLLLSLVVIPLYVAAFAMVPDTPVDRLWPIGSGLIGYCIAKLFRGYLPDSDYAKGAMRKSMWSLWGVVLLSLAMIFFGLFAVVIAFDLQLNP